MGNQAVGAGPLRRLPFHTARHTFGTLGLKHGVDIYTISKQNSQTSQ